jgi:hypothetical protein
MRSNKTGARAIQAPHDDLDEIKTRKQHTRELFLWLDQVVLDRDLPPSAFKVAYAIGQHVNRQSGEAFPSSDRIAARISMSQATVIAMVRQLQIKGHLAVDPGRAGRGHSNHYRMILKPQYPEVLEAPKIETAKPQPAELKPQPAKIKPQPADMNHFTNHLMNNQEGGLRPPPSLIESVTPIETTIVDTPPFPVNTTTVAAAVLPQPTKRETPKGARLDQSQIDESKISNTDRGGSSFLARRSDAENGNGAACEYRNGHAARRPESQPHNPRVFAMPEIQTDTEAESHVEKYLALLFEHHRRRDQQEAARAALLTAFEQSTDLAQTRALILDAVLNYNRPDRKTYGNHQIKSLADLISGDSWHAKYLLHNRLAAA